MFPVRGEAQGSLCPGLGLTFGASGFARCEHTCFGGGDGLTVCVLPVFEHAYYGIHAFCICFGVCVVEYTRSCTYFVLFYSTRVRIYVFLHAC